MFPAVTLTHSAAGVLHQPRFMIEMIAHESFQPRDKECELNRLAPDCL